MKTIGSITGLISLFLFLFLNTYQDWPVPFRRPPEQDRVGKVRIVENYGKLSLSFVDI